MSFWSYIIPRTIVRTSSRWNQDIRVIEINEEPNLLVGGSPQSGKYMRGIWEKTFAAFHIRALDVTSILTLGIGGGTAIKIFEEMYPEAHIDAVDIDGEIISLARTYFGLTESPNLHLVAADAKFFLNSSKKKYDLILIDLFSGPDIPSFVQTDTFFDVISHHVSRGGTVIFNFLRDPGYEERSGVIRKIFEERFTFVRQYPIKHNIFFIGKKK